MDETENRLLKEKLIVEFKSLPIHYMKEKNGLKSNTIREVDIEDQRFKDLLDEKATHIRIKNTETKETFERQISDVTIWNDDFLIISWDNSQAKDTEFREMIDTIPWVVKNDGKHDGYVWINKAELLSKLNKEKEE